MEIIRELERKQKERYQEDIWKPGHHLIPPVGWLNDPNGLCQKNGIYHVFFQYAPMDAEGGEKYWGHYESRDLVRWSYTGVTLSPDTEWDKDGVYSGSAYVMGDKINLYYTGNVKKKGDFDYDYIGREANTILVTTEDGIHTSEKQLLMTNQDYGKELSCHVRDPKVWKETDGYYMVQGARTMEDKGLVLVFHSEDTIHWKVVNRIKKDSLGAYMWECPDLFTIKDCEGAGEAVSILSFSPQGMKHEALAFQNEHQSGYAVLKGNFRQGECCLTEFLEWDMGFDFYAPQTFLDERGRRILIGWMGLPSCNYTNPTIEKGWQHCLTVPREITLSRGRLLQNPVEELLSLRKKEEHYKGNAAFERSLHQSLELLIKNIQNKEFALEFDGGRLSYDTAEQILSLCFTDVTGSGRDIRRVKLETLEALQILLDTSVIEIYINGGEAVMSSRYYPVAAVQRIEISAQSAEIICYELEDIIIDDGKIEKKS